MNDIAATRPPDRVTYSDWEPIFGKETRLLVASEAFPWVLREVRDVPVIGSRRRRMEFWDYGARSIPRVSHSGDVIDVTADYEPQETVGRWEWEYDERPRSG